MIIKSFYKNYEPKTEPKETTTHDLKKEIKSYNDLYDFSDDEIKTATTGGK